VVFMKRAEVTGPHGTVYPWRVEVKNEKGETVMARLPSGGAGRHDTYADAVIDATEFNRQQNNNRPDTR
jgi:hypothetical protein